MKILASPHDDDSVLFAGILCQREYPLVVVCLDSWIQPNRGEHGCSAKERAAETDAAHRILRCNTLRLGIPDDKVGDKGGHYWLTESLGIFNGPEWGSAIEAVYAPALQGGNIHHDMVNRAAHQMFPGKVVEYTTYTKTELYTAGDIEIVPTKEELQLKRRALACYESQWRINRPHFEAVLGKSEWLMAT